MLVPKNLPGITSGRHPFSQVVSIYVTAMMDMWITVDTRDTTALGKCPPPPNGERVTTNMGGYHPPWQRGHPEGGPTTMAVSTPQEWGYTPNCSTTWGEWRLIWYHYHPTVQCQGPHGVPLPRLDQKQEAPDQWHNALCITWRWTYDINKGESHDYLL